MWSTQYTPNSFQPLVSTNVRYFKTPVDITVDPTLEHPGK